MLLIGGPGKNVPGECAGLKVVRIGCDMVSILGYPGERRFYDFDAVIYWPDATCRMMPATAEAWRAPRGGHSLPTIDPTYWSIRTKGVLALPRIVFGGPTGPADGSERREEAERGAVPAVSQSPRSSADCDRIDWELGEMYDDRLRDIVRGSAGDLLAFAVMTEANRHPGALSWLSTYISIHSRTDSRVRMPRGKWEPPWVRKLMGGVQELMAGRWPLDFTMTGGEPGLEHECPHRAEWRYHWGAGGVGDDIRDVADPPPDDISDKFAIWRFPHLSGRGGGKSILFRTLTAEEIVSPKRDSDNGSCGVVLVMPAPSSLPALLRCVAPVLDQRDAIRSNACAAREPRQALRNGKNALMLKVAKQAGRAAVEGMGESVMRKVSAAIADVGASVKSVDQKIMSNKERLSARARKMGKKGGRPRNKNSGIPLSDIMRAMHARVKGGLGRGAAARAVIRDYGARGQPIDSGPDTLCKQYRTWLKHRTE